MKRSFFYEVSGGIERAPTDGALSDGGEEALDLIEPGGIGTLNRLRMVVLRGKPTEFMMADDFRYAPSVVWAT
jgi:hypothetical protein